MENHALDIIDMLYTDGETDRGAGDAGSSQLLIIHLAMGRRCRMDDQGFHIGHIGQQAEYLQVIDELLGCLFAAFDFKGEIALDIVGKADAFLIHKSGTNGLSLKIKRREEGYIRFFAFLSA